MSTIIKDSNGQLVPTVGTLGVSQVFTVTNSSVASTAFGATTTLVRVAASLGHCHIAFGAAPTASVTTSAMLPVNDAQIFAVTPGHKMAVIKDAAVTSSTVSVTELL